MSFFSISLASPRLSFFFFSLSNTRRLLARIQGGRCTRARAKTWRSYLLERVLKTAAERKKKKEKGAKEGEVNGLKRDRTAMTSKSFGVPPVPLFLPVLRFATFSSFSHTFSLLFPLVTLLHSTPWIFLRRTFFFFIPDLGQLRTCWSNGHEENKKKKKRKN